MKNIFRFVLVAASSASLAVLISASSVTPVITSNPVQPAPLVQEVERVVFSQKTAVDEFRAVRAVGVQRAAEKRAEAARVEAERVAAAKAEAERIAANTRNIHVELVGGQTETDWCIGPVLFQYDIYTMVVEHDRCGGWARFGSIKPGMTVNLSGVIKGSYTVGEIITIPQINKLDDMRFLNRPVVYLQTCIPGTNRSVVIGLY